MGVGGQRHAPAALPPANDPLYRRLGRPQGRSGLVLKISPPPGFDPRTVQLVASRYTDYAILVKMVVYKLISVEVYVRSFSYLYLTKNTNAILGC
jgi:hypothetical protein